MRLRPELLVPPDKKGGTQSESMQQMQTRMQQMMQQMTKAKSPGGNNSRNASGLAGIDADAAPPLCRCRAAALSALRWPRPAGRHAR